MAIITKATLDDVPQLCDLLTLLFTQEADFQPDVGKQSRGLRAIIEHPEIGIILVMRDRSLVVGMVNILFTVSTARGGRVAIVEDMIVRPENRSEGAGSLLLSEAIAVSQAAGCSRITLLTDRTNSAAIRFYERHGFARSAMIPMRLLLHE